MKINLNDVNHLALILLRKSSNTAFSRLVNEARTAKQSVQEIAMRRAHNMLRSLSLRQGDTA